MADIWTPTPEDVAAWNAWVAERPPAVRAVAERFFPWKLYRMASTGHRVTLAALSESTTGGPVTVRVNITGKYNALAFERQVFGIDPEDLTECDLPSPDEPLGSLNLPIEAVVEMAKISRPPEPSASPDPDPHMGCFGPLERPEA